jgi:hypothetical protein
LSANAIARPPFLIDKPGLVSDVFAAQELCEILEFQGGTKQEEFSLMSNEDSRFLGRQLENTVSRGHAPLRLYTINFKNASGEIEAEN